MRADMGKVLVERPRLGRGRAANEPGKGYRKRVRKCLDAGDWPPAREGMKRPYVHNAKSFNEHLGPLRRFLQSNVGRPWDKIYSEICRHVDRGNVVQKHILTHLFEYVVTDVILIDGKPCHGASGWKYGAPLHETDYGQQWYVCPKSGLLRQSRLAPRRRKKSEPVRRVVLSRTQMCLYLKGQWQLVTVRPMPVPGQPPGFDVVLNCSTGSYDFPSRAVSIYADRVYAVERRTLSRREALQYPIPIDWLK